MTLAHLSKLINKKIFSDDFDKSSFFTDSRKGRLKSTASMIDDTIYEEREEPEYENNYLSDSSSSSQFSLQRRYLNLDLSKLIDKLEPLDDSQSAVASKYQTNVNETIDEEGSDHSEDLDHTSNSRSHHSSSSYHASSKQLRHDSLPFYSSLYPFGLGKRQNAKSRSLICQLESETIAEELEEYEYNAPNQTTHCFTLPQRLRFNSGDMSNNTADGGSCLEQKDSTD